MRPRDPERSRWLHRPGVIATLLITSIAVSSASADVFTSYSYTRTVALPSGTSMFDVQPDGRLAALSGLNLYTETAVGSGLFSLQGTLPTIDISYGAAFLRFSPDGTKVAVGNGGSGGSYNVGVFDSTSLSGAWHALGHYDAEWYDNNSLAVNSGDFTTSQVTLFNTTTLINTTIISGIHGGSGGVAFDTQGRLFAGNGYANGNGSNTGEIRAFERAAWQAALATSPINFESSGTVIGEALSANTLGFDVEGNLHVGGGDFSEPDYDYAGLVSAAAITDAIGGGGPIDRLDPVDLRRFDPDAGSDFNFYSVGASPLNAEIYVKDYGVDTLHVYEIPEPATAAMLFIGAILGCVRRTKRRFTA